MIEHVFVFQAMHFHDGTGQILFTLFIFAHFIRELATCGGILTQGFTQLLRPGLHGSLILQLIRRKLGQINHLMQDLRWINAGQAVDHRHHGPVFVHQGFQRRAANRRC